MSEPFNSKRFNAALSSLSVAQQRQLAARFIENVLDLADERCLANIATLAASPMISEEELQAAYRKASAVYVETNPHSDLSELNFGMQAKHFVAEACMTCVSPRYEEASQCHLAQKVAMYCRMARTCASMGHEADIPDFAQAEQAAREIIADQQRLLEVFLTTGC